MKSPTFWTTKMEQIEQHQFYLGSVKSFENNFFMMGQIKEGDHKSSGLKKKLVFLVI
jgi:hypothetical protein